MSSLSDLSLSGAGLSIGPLRSERAYVDHLLVAFSAKQTKREVFDRHLQLRRDDAAIAVVYDVNGAIASSVHVFPHSVYIATQEIPVAGIGDVATAPPFRSRELAQRAFEHAFTYAANNGAVISALHSSQSAQYYRSKLQYRSIPRAFALISAAELPRADMTALTTQTLAPSDVSSALLQRLAVVYDQFAPLFNGTTVRSAAYWASWVRSDLLSFDSKLRIVTVRDVSGVVCAYAFILERTTDWLVREFATTADHVTSDNGLSAFTAVAATLSADRRIRIAAPIVSLFAPQNAVQADEDLGQMYRTIPRGSDGDVNESEKLLSALRFRHVTFETDSF